MSIPELLGKTFSAVDRNGDESITFRLPDGTGFIMHHHQDCCESVSIQDVCGELSDLVGTPILQAEENSSGEDPADCPKRDYQPESMTWTFYRIATMKGQVVIRWLGTSNGYYSERISIDPIQP